MNLLHGPPGGGRRTAAPSASAVARLAAPTLLEQRPALRGYLGKPVTLGIRPEDFGDGESARPGARSS